MKRHIGKAYLRNYYRKCLGYINTIENSKKITQQLTSNNLYKFADTVMCYVSFGNEINTHPLISKIIYDGKNIVTPTCNIEDKSLLLSYNKKFPNDYHKSSYGILEVPPEECVFTSIEKIDLVIVPGLAFDSLGHRLGNGVGYYDRFLSQPELDNTPFVALVHEEALIHKLPSEEHDIVMDYLITQDRVYRIY
jgi:5-formyltetrahydrofolate cyclo-ligase